MAAPAAASPVCGACALGGGVEKSFFTTEPGSSLCGVCGWEGDTGKGDESGLAGAAAAAAAAAVGLSSDPAAAVGLSSGPAAVAAEATASPCRKFRLVGFLNGSECDKKLVIGFEHSS